ncbi:protein of unknown function [Agrobacterium pusense]|uniref:Uncharacterized protein n=1 Tax=Agrobacterium pusense TaxID=648995 RepID=U4PUM7_9HYPH|nr:protein of unknown function [Agrobacterium pusense]
MLPSRSCGGRSATFEAPLPTNLDRISVNADDHGLLASLEASLQLVVAWSAQRLQIAWAVEQSLITLMRLDMVTHRSFSDVLNG